MDRLKVFEYPNIYIANYSTDNRACAHSCREHTLIYVLSGRLEISEGDIKTNLEPGQVAFMRRDHRLQMEKRAHDGSPYNSIVLKFSRDFLRNTYQKLPSGKLPQAAIRSKSSLMVMESERSALKKLLESVLPYFETDSKPTEQELNARMEEALMVVLSTDENLYASLFDFIDPWKIDIIDFMNRNYMQDMSLEEIAYYTGRSLSTFKRDFKKCSSLTPQKWIIRRRLQAAHNLIASGNKNISEICFDVGFKNLSHFSRIYKDTYGVSPSLANQ